MIKESLEVLDAIEAIIADKEKGDTLPKAMLDSYQEILTAIAGCTSIPAELKSLDKEELKQLQKRSFDLIVKLLMVYLF
jgi:hypothetical protein